MLRLFDSSNDHRSSRNRHFWGFGAVAALGLLLAGITLNAIHAANAWQQAQHWHAHTLKVLLTAEHARSSVNEALRGEGGYLLTRDPDFLRSYQKGRTEAPRFAAELRRLTADNPRQAPNLDALDRQLRDYFGVLRETLTLEEGGREAEAVSVIRTDVRRHDIEALLATISRIEAEERSLLDIRETAIDKAEHANDLAGISLAALGMLLLGLVAAAGVTASKARMRTLEAEEQLRRAATTDELTGLLNRRAFLAAVDVEIARSARSGPPLALALIDLDHFKSVNDRFGHAGGDEVLRKFAETAREAMRTTDVIGRLGGEEFAVLMPETDQIQSGMAAERLRDAVAGRRMALSTGALAPVTISIGVANYKPGEDRDRLIARADEALYDAKESGRNRTRLAA